MNNIERKIRTIIERHMPSPGIEVIIGDDTDLVEDLGFDSISFFFSITRFRARVRN